MPKRKVTEVIVSEDEVKRLKQKDCNENDSNEFILVKKANLKKSELQPKKDVERLSNKQKKQLQKIVKNKEDKKKINEMYEQSKDYNDLRQQYFKYCESQTKSRTNVSEKIKQLSKKKIKHLVKKPVSVECQESPDTSDFSSDDDDDEVISNNENKLDCESNNEAVNMPNEIEASVSNVQLNSDKEKEKLSTVVEQKSNVVQFPLKPKPASFVIVERLKEIEELRQKLPIIEAEADIMEAISENDVTIISGATGSGKTTQVPQFLYEGGYAKDGMVIGVTEPRRVAAISMANRVSEELNFSKESQKVGYHIRFDKKAHCGTQIKFMTDGVLLQEIKQNFELKKYSAIIVDEAHERSLHTDLLVGFLALIVRGRKRVYEKQIKLIEEGKFKEKEPTVKPLKLIIMSATMRENDYFENNDLFKNLKVSPLINVPGRQFTVNNIFNRFTNPKYLEDAFKKTVAIHRQYPAGAILVFVTSQNDVETLCKWLKRSFPINDELQKVDKNETNTSESDQKQKVETEVCWDNFSIVPVDEEAELHNTESNVNEDVDEDLECVSEEEEKIYLNTVDYKNPLHVLPLYSMLAQDKQLEIWKPYPKNQRMVIVATNVAETSITIPDIKYVVDCGLEKIKEWDPNTGLSRFVLARISKASASQRSGRAGRLGPGTCFRLYSAPVYERLPDYSEPEILRRPVDDIMLFTRDIFADTGVKISKLPPLPTLPKYDALNKAEEELIKLGALKKITGGTEITKTGRRMAQIPVAPRFAKMLIMASHFELVEYAILMVSVLTVPNILHRNSNESEDEDETSEVIINFRKDLIKRKSDLMLGDITILIGSICKLENLRQSKGNSVAIKSAEKCGIRWKAFLEVLDQKRNLIQILENNVPWLKVSLNNLGPLKQPSAEEFEFLRQLVLIGSPTNVALKGWIGHENNLDKSLVKYARRDGYRVANGTLEPVFIHPSSILCKYKFEWVVYQEFTRSEVNKGQKARNTIRIISTIKPEWLPILCPLNCYADGLMLDKFKLIDEFGDKASTLFPKFDEESDSLLVCAKNLYYGETKLPLPCGIRLNLTVDYLKNCTDSERLTNLSQRWFGQFFLEGELFPKMKEWILHFKSYLKPEMMVMQSYSKRPEVSQLLEEIESEEFSKISIEKKWKKTENYLLTEYLLWIQSDYHQLIKSNWPPLDSSD